MNSSNRNTKKYPKLKIVFVSKEELRKTREKARRCDKNDFKFHPMFIEKKMTDDVKQS